ncbi:MAG: rod shape-determining protein MreC [Patescibacteria group bacterium]
MHNILPDRMYRVLGLVVKKDVRVIGESIASEALERENAILRKQLDVAQKISRTLKLANIISIERTILVSTIVIDLGVADGIEEGMVVIGSGNVLTGRVSEVFEHTSRVILVDDPRIIVSVRLQGTSLLAESRGNRSNRIDLNLVAHNETVHVDDTIVTSGLDQFPEGLAVGWVTDVQPGDNSLFQKISGSVFFNFYESPLLFVIF